MRWEASETWGRSLTAWGVPWTAAEAAVTAVGTAGMCVARV